MIAALAAAYVAIGAALALIAARRRVSAFEVLAVVSCWPLYMPLWLERPRADGDRMRTLADALDRVGRVGDAAVTAADAPAWIARLDRGARALAGLEAAIAAHADQAAGDSRALARARAERARRRDALAAVDQLFAELTAQVGLASWVDGADDLLPTLLAALAGQLAILDPVEPPA